MPNKRHVRNYFPERHFQFRFLRLLLAGAIVQLLLTGGLIYYFLQQNYEILVKYAGLDKEIETLLYGELTMLVTSIGVVFFSYLCALTALGIIFSHRIAGVMFALKRTIREVNAGKNVRLRIRAKDEFHDVAQSFNALLDRFLGAATDGRKNVS